MAAARFGLLLASCLLAAGCGRTDTNCQPAGRHPDSAVEDEIRRLFPTAVRTEEADIPFPHTVIYGPNQTLLGYRVESDDVGTTAQGYNGPVPVRVYLDPALTLVQVRLLEHQETPAYMRVVLNSSLLERVLDYRPGHTETIDAVTLATISSAAIIQGVTRTVDRTTERLAPR